LWAVCFVRRVRVVWESSFGRLFVFGAIGASGTWQQFARIGWLRGTVDSLPRGKAFYLFGFAIIRIPSRAILVFVASSPAVPRLDYKFSPPPPLLICFSCAGNCHQSLRLQTDTMASQPASVADNWAPCGQLPEPIRENVEAVSAFVAELKYPNTPWRNILSAHTARMNVCIEDSIKLQQVGRSWRASLDWANSYAWNDRWQVQASSGVWGTVGGAKVDLFRIMFATLLLRAPGPVVRMDPSAFPDGRVACARIWEKVRELQRAAGALDVASAGAAGSSERLGRRALENPASGGESPNAERLGQIEARLGLLHERLGVLEHAAASPAVAPSSPERLGRIEARLDRLEEMLQRIDMLERALDDSLARIESQLADFGRGP